MRSLIIAVLLAVGCASAAPPRPVALDPANPAAAEAPRLVIQPFPPSTPLSAAKDQAPLTAPPTKGDHEVPKEPQKPAHQHQHGGGAP